MADQIIRKRAVYLPISREALADYRPETLTPAERAERERAAAEWRARRAAEQAERLAAHGVLVATTVGLRRAVVELHAPATSVGGDLVCHGCDAGSYAEENPEWPCSTYRLAAGWVAP